jgi:hypothetical protein
MLDTLSGSVKSDYAQKQYGDVTGAPRPGPAGPFMKAGDTFSRAESLARRVRDLVDRFCGESPPSAERGGRPATPSRPGIFGAVESTCEGVNDQIEMANMALNRLEAELP